MNTANLGWFQVRFDRLALLALLDRDVSLWDSVLCVLLALTVSVLTALILNSGILQDLYVFLFCIVCAGCQYSLLKSVQPDAASPTHGFNRLVAFGRPVYFIFFCSLLLLTDYASRTHQHPSSHSNVSHIHPVSSKVVVYGLQLGGRWQLLMLRNVLLNVLLCFPFIFSLGLLPQISTFVIYTLEQVDMHVFGGTAVTGLPSAFYVILRSLRCLCCPFHFHSTHFHYLFHYFNFF